MKQNIGAVDKVVRILAAVVIAILYFSNLISGTLSVILLAVAVIFIATSLVGTCPVYLAFRISSNKKVTKENNQA